MALSSGGRSRCPHVQAAGQALVALAGWKTGAGNHQRNRHGVVVHGRALGAQAEGAEVVAVVGGVDEQGVGAVAVDRVEQAADLDHVAPLRVGGDEHNRPRTAHGCQYTKCGLGAAVQEAEAERAVGHEADAVGLRVGQHGAFHAAVEQVVTDLVGGQVAGALAHVHHRRGEVGHAVVADLAILLELLQRRDRLSVRSDVIGPVDQQQVDPVGVTNSSFMICYLYISLLFIE